VQIFDDFGNEFIAKWGQIGNKRTSTKGYFRKNPSILLVSGVPTRLILGFENVSPQAKQISLLELSCKTGKGRHKVRLRNIPLSN